MNKNLKAFGSGFVNGVKHPFRDYTPERYSGKGVSETIFDMFGESISQGVIQTVVGYGIFIGLCIGFGYLNSKINKTPVKVKMIVDEEESKKNNK